MCYYNGVWVNRTQYLMLRGIEKDITGLNLVRPLIDGFLADTAPVIIVNDSKSDFDIVEAHWEYIPPWVKSLKEMAMIRNGIDPKTGLKKLDPKTGKPAKPIPWLNAKGEGLLSSPMWKDAALKRRCLFLSSGFYEWRHHDKVAYPHSIKYECDSELFYMAGIYNHWTDRETGEHMITAAICTSPANSLMTQIHNTRKRMPAILPKAEAEEWVFDDLNPKRITELATFQIKSEEMKYHTIRKDFKTALDPREEYHYELLPTIVL